MIPQTQTLKRYEREGIDFQAMKRKYLCPFEADTTISDDMADGVEYLVNHLKLR